MRRRLRFAATIGLTKRARDGSIGSTQTAHAHAIWRKTLFLMGLVGLLILAASIIITLGQVPMTITEVYRTLANRLAPDFFSIDPLIDHVVWQIRLPLIGGAMLAGFGLGACGCVMQAVLKNPMASPFTLGISSGAHFGVSLAAVCGVTILDGPYFLVGNAFVCALFCSGLIIALSTLKGATSETLILAGIAVNYLFQAANQLFSYIATDDQRTVMSYWGMGSLNDLNWHSMLFLGIVSAICLPLLFSKAWDLNLMTVGDESAKSMGVEATRIRVLIMAVSSLLVAAVVSFIGVIGFIGLVAPHIGRIILGNDHRYLIPAAGGIGGALLLIANAVSMNLLQSVVIPTGIIMSIIGVPLFMVLILKGKRREFWS
ncbi:FecCD family ABC transporter permease [Desulfosarcina ovata]|uniref:FecCD family ABC transporter permease n=1 Tax=Desulfosarcina ovata TaxID=83564 RepID=UPI001E3D9139|nr:iron ABC transporter permease [Desulfosarcina ovata]